MRAFNFKSNVARQFAFFDIHTYLSSISISFIFDFKDIREDKYGNPIQKKSAFINFQHIPKAIVTQSEHGIFFLYQKDLLEETVGPSF